MPDNETARAGKLLLVSAPWALFNRPSLSLGSLKAYLTNESSAIEVETAHLFLHVAQALGYGTYQRISRRVWRAESIFSALLYPEQASTAESLFASTLSKKETAAYDFNALVDQVRTITDDWVASIDWPTFDLVGFSISFCQVAASLYLISQIKQLRPSLPVVVGGSSFSGERSTDLLSVFTGIDYLVLGEGERPLSDLLRFLLTPGKRRTAAMFPDSILTAGEKAREQYPFCQLDRLDRLPMPDYDDYFKLMGSFPAKDRFFPTLPMETSRGCWWHRSDHSGQFRGCAFCNLNLQWQGYRTKAPQRVVQEVYRLAQRYQVLSLAFADNALPLNQAEAIFDGIAKLGCDFSIFAEVRANMPSPLMQKMKKAGVDTVQVGIESLSSRLLSKMNKGVRAIDNLNMMKQCEMSGILCASNLILQFPSSDDDDVDETLNAIEFSRWYFPLKTVNFWLGLESPVYRFPDHFQIRSTFNHTNLKKLFPAPMAKALRFIIQGYRGDRKRQQQRWRAVEKRVRQWKADYAIMQKQTGGRPALTFRDGGRFLIIEQHFPQQSAVKHRLTGMSADIYRFCDVPRNFEQISDLSVSHGPEQIEAFLSSMVDKRLMFEEKGSYLSLAVPFSGLK
jgi:ribosomal peptide maturation radical SAM protein 1